MSASVTAARFKVGDPLPAILVLRDLEELLGLGSSRIWELYRAGEFRRFEILPRLGNRPRFSGARLQAWIDDTEVPAIEGSRYFNGRRR